MVKPYPGQMLALGFALGFALQISGRELTDYQLGETLAQDLVAPVPLTVVDAEATEALKLKEAQRTPVILRFDPAAADKAEEELRDAFAYFRSNFLNTVQANFGRRVLSDESLALPRFQRTLEAFARQFKAFPLSTNLAEIWARGDSGRVTQAALIARLRAAMEQPIRPDAWPANLRLGFLARLVTVSNREEVLTLALADQRGFNLPRQNVIALTQAREELQTRFPEEEQALGQFVAVWLRPNCYVDLELTAQDRSRRTDPLLSADHYDAGQIIARAGQVVDRRILNAIEQIQEKTVPLRLHDQIAAEQSRAKQIRDRNQWLVAGLITVTGIAGVAVWGLARRKTRAALLPVKVTNDVAGTVISCPACHEPLVVGAESGGWRARALAAEQKFQQASEAMRSGVFAHLARLFRETLVRGLISQRGQLLEAQRTAAAEMAELERRLDELQAPLQERLRAYENRIAELEKALAAKGEENRELIRAKIKLTRHQLEVERARNRVVLN